MFKIVLRTLFVFAVGLAIAATVTMTAERSSAQGGKTTPGALRPIVTGPTGNILVPHPGPGVPSGTILTPLAPAMPGYVPNPAAIRTPGAGFGQQGQSVPYDPAGVVTVQASLLRPNPRPGNFRGLTALGSQQNQQGTQGGNQGQQGGIQGGLQGGGIGGQAQGGAAGVNGVGGVQGGGGTILGGGVQQQFNFIGNTQIFPGGGFGAIGVIQVPTVGFPAQQQVQGGFGGGVSGGVGIQGQIGGQGLGGAAGFQGAAGIGGVGKQGFAGYYGQ